MADTFDKGDLVRVAANFKNASGTDIDPTTVTFKYKPSAAGTVTTIVYPAAGITKDSTGNYHSDVDANAEGDWYWRWESTGTGQAAAEGQFYVKSEF